MKHFLLSIILLVFLHSSFANYAVVNFNLPSTKKRFFIFDDEGTLLYKTWVAHGIGSGTGIYAIYFSNRFNSYTSSLGKYLIYSIYYGKHGKSYLLKGLDSSNSNAYNRSIELHSADYIGYGKIGHSEGCLAIPTRDIQAVFKYLKVNDLIYVFK